VNWGKLYGMGGWMSEGDNSNSSSEKEDALKREPLLPIVCLPFWKKKRGLGGRGRKLDVIHGLLFQFLMPARQNSTYLFSSYSPASPIVYAQMEGLCKNRSSAWPTFLEVSRKLGRPADTCVAPNENSSWYANCCNQNVSVVVRCCCIMRGPCVERIMDVVPGGTELELQLRRGVGQAAHTLNNPHVKCTGVYCA